MTIDVSGLSDRLRAVAPGRPRTMITLGSGLGQLVEALRNPRVVPFSELPGFPRTGVAGHSGSFVFGDLEGQSVLLQAGRFHSYEGYSREIVGAPVRIGHCLGVERVLLTNAAGGLRPDLQVGDLMLIEDHIDLQFSPILKGPPRGSESRFPDLSKPYDPGLISELAEAAARERVGLARGTYAAVLGPNYETRAEVRLLRRVGADAVGMSTVPEVIVANALGLEVAGVSMVTNRLVETVAGAVSHEEVLSAAEIAVPRLARLLRGWARGRPLGDEP